MQSELKSVKVIRWEGAQHPSYGNIMQRMEREGLRPYRWSNSPNFRTAPRSHGYGKVMYCVQGSIEVIMPDKGEAVRLLPGDRLEVPRGVRYGQIVGPEGVTCVESVLPSPAAITKPRRQEQ